MNLLNSKQTAKQIGCGTRYVAYLVERNKLKPVYRAKRYFLFTEDDVTNFINQKNGHNESR